MPETRKLAAILAADVAGYSKLTASDDGVLIEFRSVVDAVRVSMMMVPDGSTVG
jgi:hypothetical protein